MKKLMCAVAAVAAGFAFAEESPAVASANIVGYQTHEVAPGATALFALQFDNLGEAKTFPIKTFITCDDFYGKNSKTGTGSDQIWMYKNGAWAKYYYYMKSSTKKWCAIDSTDEIGTDKTISSGDSFFFQRSSSATAAAKLNLAGEVKAFDLTKDIDVAAGSTTLLANPWPTAITVKNFSKYCADLYGKNSKTGTGSDQIWMYKNGAWAKYYYYVKSSTKKWCAIDSTDEIGENVKIEPGDGFFFQRSSSATDTTLTFSAQ